MDSSFTTFLLSILGALLLVLAARRMPEPPPAERSPRMPVAAMTPQTAPATTSRPVLTLAESLERAAPARQAIGKVGLNEDATTAWIRALNDHDILPRVRQDLIEDLNQAGISDPASPSREDLPLIESRLALIEKIFPTENDPANCAGFSEARKDLLRMRASLQGR